MQADLSAVLPEFTRRDGVYCYLGECMLKAERKAEALPYFERLLKEFEQSEYLADAKKRVDEIKAAGTGTGTGTF